MTSMGDAGTTKDAFDGIQQALWGLLLLFSTYLILYLINPKLVDLKEPELPIPQVEIHRAPQTATPEEIQRIEYLAKNAEYLTTEGWDELEDLYEKYPLVTEEILIKNDLLEEVKIRSTPPQAEQFVISNEGNIATPKEIQRIEYLVQRTDNLTTEGWDELKDLFKKYPLVVDAALVENSKR